MSLKKNRSCRFFILPTIALIAVCGFFLVYSERSTIHFYVNQFHADWADTLFKYVTHLGDGAIFALAIPLAFVKNLRWFFVVACTAVIVLLVTAILKQWLFQGLPRPSLFLGEENLYLVPGVKMHTMNSFPSGHTTAAFAFYFVLCFLLANKLGSFLLFVLAALVGFSRIYLSQHFLIDVMAGAMLGLICGYFAIALISSWKWNKLEATIQDIVRGNA